MSWINYKISRKQHDIICTLRKLKFLGTEGKAAFWGALCSAILSHVWLFVTPWTAAPQLLLSMGFSWQEYWSGLPFPTPGDLSNPGIEPESPAMQVIYLPCEPSGKSLLEANGHLFLLPLRGWCVFHYTKSFRCLTFYSGTLPLPALVRLGWDHHTFFSYLLHAATKVPSTQPGMPIRLLLWWTLSPDFSSLICVILPWFPFSDLVLQAVVNLMSYTQPLPKFF